MTKPQQLKVNRVAWQMLRAGRITPAQYHARIDRANRTLRQIKHEMRRDCMDLHLPFGG